MKEKNGEHPFGDTGQLILLGLFLVIWAGDSFLLHQSTFLADLVPVSIRVIILSVCVSAAFYLGRSGHAVVSQDTRPAGVVRTGAFRYIRHPLYLGSLMFYLGLAISTASLFSLALLVGIFAFYNHIASYEEKLLLARLGDDYRRYMKTTGKWMPGIGRPDA